MGQGHDKPMDPTDRSENTKIENEFSHHRPTVPAILTFPFY